MNLAWRKGCRLNEKTTIVVLLHFMWESRLLVLTLADQKIELVLLLL